MKRNETWEIAKENAKKIIRTDDFNPDRDDFIVAHEYLETYLKENKLYTQEQVISAIDDYHEHLVDLGFMDSDTDIDPREEAYNYLNNDHPES